MQYQPLLFSLVALALIAAAAAAQAPGPAGAARHAANAGAEASLFTELTRLEREYMRVPVTRDTAAAARLSVMDATIINPDGSTESGAQQLRDLASGVVVFDSASADSMRVRALGPNAAVVSGIAIVQGHATPPGGQPQDISGRYRFIDVWQRVGGRWRVVAEAATRIAGQ